MRPSMTERMMNVEPGQGTEDEGLRMGSPSGSSSSRKPPATVSGGVTAVLMVESSGSDTGLGSTSWRDIMVLGAEVDEDGCW